MMKIGQPIGAGPFLFSDGLGAYIAIRHTARWQYGGVRSSLLAAHTYSDGHKFNSGSEAIQRYCCGDLMTGDYRADPDVSSVFAVPNDDYIASRWGVYYRMNDGDTDPDSDETRSIRKDERIRRTVMNVIHRMSDERHVNSRLGQ